MSRPRHARAASKSDKLRLISSRPREMTEHVSHPDSTEALNCEDLNSTEYSAVRSALILSCQRFSSGPKRSKPRQTSQGFMLLPINTHLNKYLPSFSDLLYPLLTLNSEDDSCGVPLFRIYLEMALSLQCSVLSWIVFAFASSCFCLRITISMSGTSADLKDDW